MYCDFFNLKDEPFRLTPDPRYLHLAEPHRTALALLLGGIYSRKGLMLLTGPVGTGKSTLLHAVLKTLSDKAGSNPVASALLFHPTLNRDELLEALLAEFDVPCTLSSKPGRLSALLKLLLDAQRRGGTAVFLVDEAHLFTAEMLEEIRLLNNMDSPRGKLLQVVLCGQPELKTLLEQPAMQAIRQRVAVECSLRSLSQIEARAYIHERLQHAGLQGPSPFTPQSLQMIYASSRGVPRVINLICDACLSIGFRTRRRQVQSDMVEDAAASLSLAPSSVVSQPPPKVPSRDRVEDAAASLSLAPSSVVSQPPPKVPSRDHSPLDSAKKSTVDILIEAMRQKRMAAGG